MRVVKGQTLAVAALSLAIPGSAWAAAGLNLFPRLELLVLNIVVFLLLVYPVNRLLLQPLVRVLEEREARTLGALQSAEAALTQANELRGRFEARLREARERAAEQRGRVLSEGESETRQVLERARSEAADALEGVRAGVTAELDTARAALREDAAELAGEAAAKILGRPL